MTTTGQHHNGTTRRRRGALAIAAVGLALALAGAAMASFSGNGKLTMDLKGAGPERVLSDGHGGLLLYGRFYGSQGLVRLKANGDRDGRFGGHGFFEISANDMLVGGDGRIYLVGPHPYTTPGYTDVELTRLRPNGELDSSFGRSGGTVSIDLGRAYDAGQALAIGRRGTIWFAGTSSTPEEGRGGGGESSTIVGRLLSNGKLDRTFSGDGLVRLRGSGHAQALAATSDGGALVLDAGELVRLKKGGALLKSFGDGGAITVSIADGPGEYRYFETVGRIGMLRGDQFILVGTTTQEGVGYDNFHGAAVKFRADGRINRAYGTNGIAEIKFRGVTLTFPSSFVVGGRGRLFVAAGLTDPSTGAHRFGTISLLVGGRRDGAFGSGGEAITRFAGNSWAADIAFKPRRRLAIAGYSHSSGFNLTAVAQLSLTGHPVR